MIETAIVGSFLGVAGLLALKAWGADTSYEIYEDQYETMLKANDNNQSGVTIGETGDTFAKHQGLWYHVGPNGEMTGGYELIRLHKEGEFLEAMRPGGFMEIPGR